jgi:DNA topoisomerase-1
MKSFENTIYNQILLEPEKVIEEFDLVYTYPEQLQISREKKGKDFIYLKMKSLIKAKKILNRIETLVIPPAWQKVKISHIENGHLQAVGRDAKNRRQYKYHPKWSEIRNQTKFFKLLYFAHHLPKIRKQVDKDLDQKKWNQSKVLALIIRLLEETHIRIGNDQYAKRNKTYGLTTLRSRHVKTYKDKIKFEFVGKKGKEHSVTLRNKKLTRLILKCEEIPGWDLFKYYDEHGEKHSVNSTMLNDYLKTITGSVFTAKDFRTWSATKIAFETLLELEVSVIEAQTKKNIIVCYDAAANSLGNTRAVCKAYYVHPAVTDYYSDGSIKPYFDLANRVEDDNYLNHTEKALVKLLESYKPLS